MTRETTAQNVKNQLNSGTENERIEELKRKHYMDSSPGKLIDHQ